MLLFCPVFHFNSASGIFYITLHILYTKRLLYSTTATSKIIFKGWKLRTYPEIVLKSVIMCVLCAHILEGSQKSLARFLLLITKANIRERDRHIDTTNLYHVSTIANRPQELIFTSVHSARRQEIWRDLFFCLYPFFTLLCNRKDCIQYHKKDIYFSVTFLLEMKLSERLKLWARVRGTWTVSYAVPSA